MQVRLTVPSKTFLIGEYAVLDGGSALVLNTEPRFEALINTPGDGLLENIHRNSSAGLWARWNRETFENVNFQFQDPHEGRGGFGASSAQFLLTWVWNQLESTPFSKLSEGVDVEAILADYLSIFEDQTRKPSGVDVVAQCTGGLALVKTKPLSVQSRDWAFEGIDYLIVATGNKVNTHTHLAQLKNSGLSELKDLSDQAWRAVVNHQPQLFIDAINEYRLELGQQGKTVEATSELLRHWQKAKGVVAAKGCGALGADSFVLIVEEAETAAVKSQLEQSGLKVIGTKQQLSGGLGMQLDMQGDIKSVSVKTPQGLVQ